MYLNKTIDSFGTGFGRVFSVCKKEQINYKYGNNEFGFYFDFIRTSIDNINVTRNVTIKLSSVQRDVLSLIDSKKGIKKSELAQELNKTDMTIHRAIKKLIEYPCENVYCLTNSNLTWTLYCNIVVFKKTIGVFILTIKNK